MRFSVLGFRSDITIELQAPVPRVYNGGHFDTWKNDKGILTIWYLVNCFPGNTMEEYWHIDTGYSFIGKYGGILTLEYLVQFPRKYNGGILTFWYLENLPEKTMEEYWQFDTWYSFPGNTMEVYWQFDTWYIFPGKTMEEFWQFDTCYSFPGKQWRNIDNLIFGTVSQEKQWNLILGTISQESQWRNIDNLILGTVSWYLVQFPTETKQ